MDSKLCETRPLAAIALATFESETNDMSVTKRKTFLKIIQDQIDEKITYEEACITLAKNSINAHPASLINKVLTAIKTHKSNQEKPDTEIDDSKRHTRTWSQEEDINIIAAIHQFGPHDWKNIAEFVGNGRSRSQCSQRWARALDPRITRLPWDKNEETKLLELVHKHGEHSWAVIAKFIGTRSDVQCRYKYYQILSSRRVQAEKKEIMHFKQEQAKTTTSLKVAQITLIPKASSICNFYNICQKNYEESKLNQKDWKIAEKLSPLTLPICVY